MLGEIAPKIQGIYQSGGLFLIQSRTLSQAVSSFTFSNIPQNFSHLEIRIQCQLSTGYNPTLVTINGLGSGYYYQRLAGSNSSATASESGATSGIRLGDATSTANNASFQKVEIPGYTSTIFIKTIHCTCGNDASGTSSGVEMNSGSCNTLLPVISVTLTAGSGNFIIGSNFWLYGIY